MKKSLLALVAALACAGAAHAQSTVQISGLVDVYAGSMRQSGSVGRTSTVGSGGMTTSWIGFSGKEDLGGGLKAVFILEAGIGLDTGTSLQSGRMFGRQALIGLQGHWGNLYLGRQNSMMLEWMSKYNTMDNATWSAKVHDGAFSGRMDNAIKYTQKFGSVEMATYYSTNYNGQESSDSAKIGRQYGLGAQYRGEGFSMAALYDQKQGTTLATKDNADKHLTLGARYKFGKAEVLGGYLMRRQEAAGAADVRTNMAWIGGSYQVTGPLQLSASVYHTDRKNSNQDPTSVIAMAKYALSKRTDLYLIASYAANKDNASQAQTLGVNGFGTNVAAGKNQFGTMAGIRHAF
ncbi:MAG: porin [Comamonas sp.]